MHFYWLKRLTVAAGFLIVVALSLFSKFAINSRTVFNAILWILGSGAAWRDLPEEYGNWNSIYHKFRNWIEAGVFEKIFQVIVGKCKEYQLVEHGRFINSFIGKKFLTRHRTCRLFA